MSYLLIKNDGLGDLILASGIIGELSRLFSGDLDLERSFIVSRDDMCFNRYLKCLGFFRPIIKDKDCKVLDEISKRNYDYVVCLRRFIRASRLFIISSIRSGEKHCLWQLPADVPEGQKGPCHLWRRHFWQVVSLALFQ